MVATRRGTRVQQPEDEEGGPEEQKPEDLSPTSPIRTRRSVRKDGRTGEYSTDESMSSKSLSKCETVTHSTQITTRRRRRSGQSDAEVSEAGSNASNTSTTRSRSRQSLGQLTESTRKLRSQRSALITEPIFESKENLDSSEDESDCSSVSTTRRRQTRSASHSVSTRSRKLPFYLEPSSDVSDAESDSSASEVKIIETRSTRNTRARRPSQKEQISDTESCSSGFSLRPLATRSSSRNKPNVQIDELEFNSENPEDDSRDQEMLMKQSPKKKAVKSHLQSSVENQNVLSSPRRSSRYQPTIQEEEDEDVSEANRDRAQDKLKQQSPKTQTVKPAAQSPVGEQSVLSSVRRSSRIRPPLPGDEVLTVSSNDHTQSYDTLNRVLDVDQPEVGESSKIKEDLCMETDPVSSVQSNEPCPEENILSPLVLQLSDNSVDDELANEETQVVKSKDATLEANKPSEDLKKSGNMAESLNVCLIIDSDESEKSEHSDDDDVDDEEEEEEEEGEAHSMEEEEDIEQVIDVQKSKKSTQQPQDVMGDWVFVEANKPSQDLKESSNTAESMKECLTIDSDESEMSQHSVEVIDDEDEEAEEEHSMEEDEDIEQVIDVQKSKKASTQQPQDVMGDGLFVIDTAPGMDTSKKYYMEDEQEEDEQEEHEPEEIPGPEEEEEVEDDEDFIDKEEEEDEDEEQMLLNRPKSGFSLSTSIDTGINIKKMGGLYINFDAHKPNPGPSLPSKMKKGDKKTEESLQKSVITPDFEKKDSVPPYKESRFKLKKMRKEERDKTTGRGWFDMKAPELTDELKNDLKALKMRSAMDSKRFYKKNDRDGFPKYFEVGTVVDNPLDFYHSRIPKKDRKRTMVEELLADSEFRRNNKKKYMEIMAEKAARAEGKKFRKKKKFRT
ncbi:deoxynucleotidyltransferase terminal-interacting protein 2 [Anomaloglossus baeobatrachus]|uniref:deoxynucleotidyltransferase terminal-interacting protein 2 n=1 Tax=Anomaloglossus baeobatrachus TaxID=238106 RepID=UPI003F50CF3F